MQDQPASSGSWSKLFGSPAAADLNPAMLGSPVSTEILLLSRRPYLVAGLSETRIYGIMANNKWGGIAISAGRFGNADFSSFDISLGYGITINRNLNLGTSIKLFRSGAKGFGKRSEIIPGISLQWSSSAFTTGIFIRYSASSDNSPNRHDVLAGIGIGKDFSNQLYIDASIYYTFSGGPASQFSLQYQLLDAWRLILRLQTNPFRYGFETGYRRNKFSLRISSDWHPQIGWTPGLVILFTIVQK